MQYRSSFLLVLIVIQRTADNGGGKIISPFATEVFFHLIFILLNIYLEKYSGAKTSIISLFLD